MKTRVFHNPDFTDYFMKGKVENITVSLVADVEDAEKVTGDEGQMDYAYCVTNNITDSWAKNEGVKAYAIPCRSTSMGDLMQRGSKIYVVDVMGFRELTPEEQATITFDIPKEATNG